MDVMPSMARGVRNEERRRTYMKHIAKSQGAPRIAAIVKIAETLLTLRPEQVDAEPNLFNVQNGTLELSPIRFREHRREDFITHISPVQFVAEATCPAFEKFVGRIFQDAAGHGRPDLIRYVRKAAAYGMTGDTSEQCMFVLHGNGRNGKTTLLNLMKHVMGDYAMVARSELLMKSVNKTNHEGEANLFGKRLVVSSETNEGQAFDESTLKRMADKQAVRARPIYGAEFEFQPTHKIWMDCNHLPAIRGDDVGVWRRIKRVPFEVIIPEAEKDVHLEDKLKAEDSGILNWLLAGLTAYQAEGLTDPPCVAAANSEYKEDSDRFGAFLSDCTAQVPGGTCPKGDLYKLYQAWCSGTGVLHPITQQQFGKKMKERGYHEERTSVARFWSGLEVLTSARRELQIAVPASWARRSA